MGLILIGDNPAVRRQVRFFRYYSEGGSLEQQGLHLPARFPPALE